MTISIRGNTPDLIAAALYQLGYLPSGCILLLGLHPTSSGFGTPGVAARVDLPEPADHRAAAEELAAVLVRTGASAALCIVFSDDPRSRVRALGRRLRAALRAADIEVVDVVQVHGEHYRGVDCRDRACCPHPGRPLGEVLGSAAAAALVAEGFTLVGSEAALIADVAPGPPAADLTDLDPTDPELTGPEPTGPDHATTSRPRGVLLGEWFDALDGAAGGAGGDGVAGDDGNDGGGVALRPGFARGLRDVILRDAVLMSLSGSAREDAFRYLRDTTTTDGFMTSPPDRGRASRATSLLARAAREADRAGWVEVVAVLAWAAWWQGSGARARLLVERALDVDPGHRLSLLVQGALVTGVAPPWAMVDALAGPVV